MKELRDIKIDILTGTQNPIIELTLYGSEAIGGLASSM